MKKGLIAVLVLLAALIAGALVAPGFVDWNRYKDRIAARLESEFGREVAIAGDLSLALLPAPALSAEGLSLAGPEGADEETVTIKSLRLRLAPSALLRGQLQVASLELVEPVLVVARPPATATAVRPPTGNAAAGEGVAVAFDSVVVEDGAIVYRRPDGEPERVTDIDLQLNGRLAGPLEFQGEASWRGQRFAVSGETGRFDRGSTTPLALTVALPVAEARAHFDGRWSRAPEATPLAGRLELTGTDLAAVAGALGVEVPAPLAREYRIRGQLRGEGRRIALDDVDLLVGQTEGSGALSVALGKVPRFDVALSFRSIDLDAGLAVAAAASPEAEGEAPQAAEAFALPTGFEATLDVAADAVVWRGAVLRQGVVQASLRDGVLTVDRVGAFGPGGSDLTAYGSLRPAEGVASFQVGFETAADNLRAVLDWLGVPVPDLPPDRLRKFAARGAANGTLAGFQVPEVEVWLDTTHLRGAANVQRGQRLAVGANVTLDNLNIDAYRPAPDVTAGAGDAAGGDGAADWGILGAVDANIRAQAERLTLAGHALRDVMVDGTVIQGDVTLREARVADVDGAGAVTLAGGVRGLAAGAPVFDDFTYSLRTDEPVRALRLLGLQPPPALAEMAPATFAGTLDGPLDELRLGSDNRLGPGSLAVSGQVRGLPGEPAFALDVEAAHPQAASVLRLFAPDYRPAGELGALSLAARIEGEAAAFSVANLALAVGEARLAGEGTVALDGRPSLTARLRGENLVLDPFLPARRAALLRPPPGVTPAAVGMPAPGAPWSAEPLPLAWLDAANAKLDISADVLALGRYRLIDPVATLALAEGVAEMRRLKASLFDGAFTLSGHVASDGAATARLTLANAEVQEALELVAGMDVVSGRLSAEAELATRGESSLAMANNLAGSGRIEVLEGVLEGIDLSQAALGLRRLDSPAGLLGVLRGSLFGGSTPFHELRGTFTAAEGVVTSDDLRLTADSGAGEMTAEINLPAWTLDANGSFALAEFPDAPPLGLRLQGPLDAPRRNLEVEALQAYLLSRGLSRLLAPGSQEEEAAAPEGEEEAPAGQEDTPPPSGEFEPEDIMRGLLDMLQRRQQQ